MHEHQFFLVLATISLTAFMMAAVGMSAGYAKVGAVGVLMALWTLGQWTALARSHVVLGLAAGIELAVSVASIGYARVTRQPLWTRGVPWKGSKGRVLYRVLVVSGLVISILIGLLPLTLSRRW